MVLTKKETRAGESLQPVECDYPEGDFVGSTMSYEESLAGAYPDEDLEGPTSGGKLNWREMIAQANLMGPARVLAGSAQVLELDQKHVKLRVKGRSLITPAIREELIKVLTDFMGQHFQVHFEFGEVEGETVLDREHREKERAHQELVKRFKANSVVNYLIENLGVTLDEDSVSSEEQQTTQS